MLKPKTGFDLMQYDLQKITIIGVPKLSKGHEAFELKKIIDILVNLIKPLQFIMFKDLSNFSNKLKIISFSPIFPKRLISKT